MHVLRRVLEQTVSSVVVLDVVQRDGLEPPPAQRQDQRVSGFQDATVPAVFLQPQLRQQSQETLALRSLQKH